jgi:Fe-S-cluster containining protein
VSIHQEAAKQDICFRCGECCRRFQALLDRTELQQLASFLTIPPGQFIAQYSDPRWPGQNNWLLKQTNGACPFLVGDKREYICAIHSVKPQACREWKASFSKPECRQGLAHYWHLAIFDNQLHGNPESIRAFEDFCKNT